jgi:putative zinc finger/helix-turn-helix YgiT family protein
MKQDDILNDPCPNCGAVHAISLLSRAETVKVRGQSISVNASAYVCSACGADFDAPGATDALEVAYRRFREQKGLLQPEQMKAWRQSLGLKQSELALLLGWSTATVSRYENGALQDDAHDRAMRAAMTPQGLSALVNIATDLPEDAQKKLKSFVKHQAAAAEQLEKVVATRLVEVMSRHLRWEKLCEAVLFYCSGTGMWRQKLNKMLFYSDFLHAKHFNRTVTGLSYVRSAHGPVPHQYELIYATLQESGVLQIIETTNGEYIAYRHHALRKPDVSCFSDTELEVLLKVRRSFERVDAEKLQLMSRSEEASRRTAPGERVRLSLAKSLSLSLEGYEHA